MLFSWIITPQRGSKHQAQGNALGKEIINKTACRAKSISFLLGLLPLQGDSVKRM